MLAGVSRDETPGAVAGHLTNSRQFKHMSSRLSLNLYWKFAW